MTNEDNFWNTNYNLGQSIFEQAEKTQFYGRFALERMVPVALLPSPSPSPLALPLPLPRRGPVIYFDLHDSIYQFDNNDVLRQITYLPCAQHITW